MEHSAEKAVTVAIFRKYFISFSRIVSSFEEKDGSHVYIFKTCKTKFLYFEFDDGLKDVIIKIKTF